MTAFLIVRGKTWVYDAEYAEEVGKYKWHWVGKKGKYLIANFSIDGKKCGLLFHVLLYKLGHKISLYDRTFRGKYEHLCHKDFNRHNCCLSNLELQHRTKNQSEGDGHKKSSKYIGVNWNKKTEKWMSRIGVDGKKAYLGLFTDEIEAAKAHDQYIIEHNLQESHLLNFPEPAKPAKPEENVIPIKIRIDVELRVKAIQV